MELVIGIFWCVCFKLLSNFVSIVTTCTCACKCSLDTWEKFESSVYWQKRGLGTRLHVSAAFVVDNLHPSMFH